MVFRTEAFPLVSYPVDNAWCIFRDFETEAVVYVKSLTPNATVDVASGIDFDPTNLGSPTTLTFTQEGVTQTVSLPVTGTGVNRATRVLPTSGKVSVTFVSPSDIRCFMSVPAAVNFSL